MFIGEVHGNRVTCERLTLMWRLVRAVGVDALFLEGFDAGKVLSAETPFATTDYVLRRANGSTVRNHHSTPVQQSLSRLIRTARASRASVYGIDLISSTEVSLRPDDTPDMDALVRTRKTELLHELWSRAVTINLQRHGKTRFVTLAGRAHAPLFRAAFPGAVCFAYDEQEYEFREYVETTPGGIRWA